MEKKSKNITQPKKQNSERPKTNNINKPISNQKTNLNLHKNLNLENQKPQLKINNNKTSLNSKNKIEVVPFQRNKKYASVKKRFIKDNYLYTIVYFLDSKSLLNFMLSNKQFYRIGVACDDVWYDFYIKKFCIPPKEPIDYEKFRANWRNKFIEKSKTVSQKNYDDLKKKFLTKYQKNIYSAKKDHYYLTNNLYKHLKPYYYISINNKLFPVKYILTNKILSHINVLIHFDNDYQDLNKIQNIRLLFNAKEIGVYNRIFADYNFKQIHLNITENDGIINKIFKIYYYEDLIISTYEKNYIFFINISLPICKICERVFDYLRGIHSFNLDYSCDCDSKFGLYDYSLLINLKSWNKIYFSLSVTTCDFKEDENMNDLFYINESVIATSNKIQFDIKSLTMKDILVNFLIFDIVLLTYNGDHVLCESKPIILRKDNNRVDYDENDSNHYIAIIKENKYNIIFKFNINEGKKYYALVYTELRLNKKYVESIFKKY